MKIHIKRSDKIVNLEFSLQLRMTAVNEDDIYQIWPYASCFLKSQNFLPDSVWTSDDMITQK